LLWSSQGAPKECISSFSVVIVGPYYVCLYPNFTHQ
jgi:hypothetical protein